MFMARLEDEIKQKEFKSPFHKLVLNITYSHFYLNESSQKMFKQYKITSQQYNVLRILRGAHPKGKCVGDVKQVMLDKNPDLTRLVDRLVQKGFVKRTHSKTDRRQVEVSITNAGLELLKTMDAVEEDLLGKTQINLTEEETVQLNDLLDKLRG